MPAFEGGEINIKREFVFVVLKDKMKARWPLATLSNVPVILFVCICVRKLPLLCSSFFFLSEKLNSLQCKAVATYNVIMELVLFHSAGMSSGNGWWVIKTIRTNVSATSSRAVYTFRQSQYI